MERNPYILIALSNWREVDRLAHENFGVQGWDSRRVVAAAECSVYELLDSIGSTLFDRETVINQTASKLRGDRGLAIKAVDESVLRRVLVEHDGGLRAVGPALMEEAVGRWFTGLRQRPASWPLLVPPEALAATLSALELEYRHGIQLNAEQRQVVRLGLIEPISLVCGGAGVGKTTALRALAECLHIAQHRACLIWRKCCRPTRRPRRSARHLRIFIEFYQRTEHQHPLNCSAYFHEVGHQEKRESRDYGSIWGRGSSTSTFPSPSLQRQLRAFSAIRR